MAQTQEVKASLGCGTLILIAIIVIIFNGHNDHDNLEKKMDELLQEVATLRQEVAALRPEPEPQPQPER